MRISDWSSDVCSSDLAQLLFVHVVEQTAEVARRQIGLERPWRVGIADDDAEIRHVLDQRALVGHQLADIAALTVERDVDATEQLDVQSGRRDDRSEEHTSELQSLMRISYAVFFLQKKTYTNKDSTE